MVSHRVQIALPGLEHFDAPPPAQAQQQQPFRLTVEQDSIQSYSFTIRIRT